MQLPRTAPTRVAHSPIVELRQYTLHPGKRDVLIDLFEREFIESQEREGIEVIGQFRDLTDPDRFVWLRGFREMPARARALEAFYTGPIWKAHRDAANETMVDSDNVLLLRPARPELGFPPGARRSPGTDEEPEGFVLATVYSLDAPPEAGLLKSFYETLQPALASVGAFCLGVFVTEPSANNFPRLPVREGENVLVWFARFPDRAAYERHAAALAQSPRWRWLTEELQPQLRSPAQTLELEPTSRSALH